MQILCLIFMLSQTQNFASEPFSAPPEAGATNYLRNLSYFIVDLQQKWKILHLVDISIKKDYYLCRIPHKFF